MSWRHIGAAQEDITALLFEDLMRHLDDPHRLVVTTDYTVRGGIHTVCSVDSREQRGRVIGDGGQPTHPGRRGPTVVLPSDFARSDLVRSLFAR